MADEGNYEGGVAHPNREKPESKQTRAIVTFLLLASAGILTVIAIGGWEKFQGAKPVTVFYILVYLLFAFYVSRWNRGVLPVATALSVILIIFAAVAAPAWFSRDKEGFDSPPLPEDLLGLLTLCPDPARAAADRVRDAGLPAAVEHRGRQPRRPRGARAAREPGHRPRVVAQR